MTAETFGERFSRLVDQAGLSAGDVCQIVGWKSESSFYKARRGDIGSINAIGLLRLARKLNVSPYYLAGEANVDRTSLLDDPKALAAAIRATHPTVETKQPNSDLTTEAADNLDERFEALQDHLLGKIDALAAQVAALSAAPAQQQSRRAAPRKKAEQK